MNYKFLLELTEKEITLWLAALFDGEGAFGPVEYATSSEAVGLRVEAAIGQAGCDELLYDIQEILGYGTVSKGHSWRCGNQDVLKFIARLEPYLTVKSKQVSLIKSLIGTIIPGNNKLSPEQFLMRARLLEIWRSPEYRRKVGLRITGERKGRNALLLKR